ncbi:MAG: OmpH family outer membrane protein [candidate division Zixibacteria bacterium]|nr:OmpH family outer membrane protein [candidate division Zixibacteria bacterium]
MFKKPVCFIIGAIAVFSFLSTANVIAQEKVGFIDSQRIFAESKDYSDAQAKFDKDIAAWNKQAEELQAEIDVLEQELEGQSLLLTKAKREEKERLLDAKKEAFQDYVNATFGPDGKAERRNAELVRPIRDRIMRIIERIAIENNYAMVFDAGVTSIAYAKKTLDMTDMVLEELEKGE